MSKLPWCFSRQLDPRRTSLQVAQTGPEMGKQPKRGGRQKFSAGPADDDEEEKTKDVPTARGLGGQAATAGIMPPSDSDDDDEDKD